MHLFFLLAVAVLIFLLINQARNRSTLAEQAVDSEQGGNHSSPAWTKKIAFISKGKLFYRDPQGEIRQIHSPYIQGVVDRMERKKQLHAWKENTSLATSFTGGSGQLAAATVEIQVTSAQFVSENKLLYFLRDQNFGGLFEYDLEANEEKRLLHQQSLFYQDISRDEKNGQLLCSQNSANGTAHIVQLGHDGGDSKEMSGGDTVDSSPCWVPNDGDKILFQSAGLARSEEGYVIAQGPSSIQMLDINEGTLETVLEDPQFDFLSPQVCNQGLLYFIRRPYDLQKYSRSSLLIDTIKFPFRLLRAVFHYLNFFSLMYSRKPLTSASGPEVQADLKDILVKGKRIDAENALKKESRVNGVPSLVPKSWQLVRREKSGKEQILATNVASFKVCADNRVLYSNGYGVFLSDGASGWSVIFRDKLIADIIVE